MTTRRLKHVRPDRSGPIGDGRVADTVCRAGFPAVAKFPIAAGDHGHAPVDRVCTYWVSA